VQLAKYLFASCALMQQTFASFDLFTEEASQEEQELLAEIRSETMIPLGTTIFSKAFSQTLTWHKLSSVIEAAIEARDSVSDRRNSSKLML
jgi:hypothetical protein